ncbi:hypothetical protein NAT51_15250 [Flavobacterium amniphilum]|uniref:hypothetical protein n=1 Tax=Flavobacterium amniphilum TaxID=1834035 RepID=UPI00202A5CFE|nr:hypothetical protein [Flavobacterium amniphilum]MCL9806891.1 hypothetical protein [Flavobacterium amniphilum]
MELGIYRNFWDGQPNHLPFLSFRSSSDEPKEFNLKLSITKLEAILRKNPVSIVKKDLQLLLNDENWRLHIVASIVLLMLKKENSQDISDLFWQRIEKGSWVSPQILVSLSYSDFNFENRSKQILNDGININYAALSPIEHHSARGGTTKRMAGKKVLAAIDYLVNGIVNDTPETDCGGSICKSWKESIDNQNNFKTGQF